MANATNSASAHDSNNAERWLPVPGYEGLYEVSDHGRVRSLPRTTPRRHRFGGASMLKFPGRMLKPSPFGKSGHVCVNLCKDGKQKCLLIHRLVLEAFVGPRPEGQECRHFDGNGENNFLTNLLWGTRAENMADRTRLGEHNPHLGEARPNAVLTENLVRRIRKMRVGGAGGSKIARDLGLNINTVFGVIHRRNWKWVDD